MILHNKSCIINLEVSVGLPGKKKKKKKRKRKKNPLCSQGTFLKKLLYNYTAVKFTRSNLLSPNSIYVKLLEIFNPIVLQLL